ncbi:hypothetical protein CC86DRAFT_462444 [Ophiobolus disseminans]|uniref:Uncharacterized protein n=1 Tax=Ophiobolus disseminans TaxID=1469910 RepID=A0A6A7AFG5_9PLEO|nr:hypothetical protein CC86DRAFT_462444 [Ophiobolus disseminans]
MAELMHYAFSPGGFHGLHGMHGHMIRSPYDPWNQGAYWPGDSFHEYSNRCACEFCDVWGAIPDVEEILHELALLDPYRYEHIRQMHDSIHSHYRMGYDRDGPESYYLSREVEKLSRLLQKLHRHTPWGGRGLGDIASQLKHFGRDVQVGRRRGRYGHPRPRYYDGRYFPRDRWGY